MRQARWRTLLPVNMVCPCTTSWPTSLTAPMPLQMTATKLMSVGNGSSDACGSDACGTQQPVSSTAQYSQQIIEAGAVDSLIDMLRHGDDASQENAAGALRNLTATYRLAHQATASRSAALYVVLRCP